MKKERHFELPTELLEKVLAKLPLKSLLTFRAVSRQWKSIIEGPGLFYEGSPPKPVLSYFHPGDHPFVTSRTLPPSLFFAHSAPPSWKPDHLPFRHVSERINLVAVDGGLFCFSTGWTPNAFVIYNPLSKQWRELFLPTALRPRLSPEGSAFETPSRYPLVGLTVSRETGVYHLLVAGIQEDGGRANLMYSSSTRSWKRCASVPLLESREQRGDGEWRCKRSLCCGGNLYWLLYDLGSDEYDKMRALLKYYVEKDEWAVMELAPYENLDFSLVPHDGNTFLVDRIKCDFFLLDRSLGNTSEPVSPQGSEITHVGYQGLIDVMSHATDEIRKCIAEGECFYFLLKSKDFSDYPEGKHYAAEYNLRKGAFTWVLAVFPSSERDVWAFAPTLRAWP